MSSVPIPLPHMSPSWVLGHLLAVIIAPSGDTDACSAMTHRQSSPIHAPFSRRDSVRLRRICSGYHRELELDLEFLAPTLEKTYYRVNTQAKVSKKKKTFPGFGSQVLIFFMEAWLSAEAGSLCVDRVK